MSKKMCYIFNIMKRVEAYGKTTEAVLGRIRKTAKKWGGAFTPSDFADLGDPRVVGVVLGRLNAKGVIRRIRRGVYEVLEDHSVLGRIGASPKAVLEALNRRDGLELLPSGAHAANLLGLTMQVPARRTYGTSGRSRVVKTAGLAEVELRHRSPRALVLAGKTSGWLAEALRHMGKENLDTEQLKHLRAKISPKDRRELRRDMRYVAAWMRPAFELVASDE
jgi:hypothetical protein